MKVKKIISNKEKKPLTDSDISKLEEKFDSGNGLTITIGNSNDKNDKMNITYHYSNKLDKLNIKGIKMIVAVSSVETENQELLHFLLKKSRES
jgi:hypothetical protein